MNKCKKGNKRHPDQPKATLWFGVMVWILEAPFWKVLYFGAYLFELLTTDYWMTAGRNLSINTNLYSMSLDLCIYKYL